MLTRDARHQQTRATQSLSSSLWWIYMSHASSVISTLCCGNVLFLLMMLLMGISTVRPANALSIDANLAHAGSRYTGRQHQEWDVWNDWWRQTMEEDYRRQFDTLRFEPLYAMQHHRTPVRSRSFAEPSAPLLSPSQSSVEELELAESVVELMVPSKRIWPINKVQFPIFPQTSSSSTLSLHHNGDLATAESLAMKTSSTGDTRNILLPKWRNRINRTTTTTTNTKNNVHSTRNRPIGGVSSSVAEATKWSRAKPSSYIPKSSLASLQNLFYEYFNTVRSSAQNRQTFNDIKRNLRQKFLDLGLATGFQSFNATKPRKHKPEKGHNLIGIWPGVHRNASNGKDSILVIGAHYDTVPHSMGIEDNASGSVAVIELARLLQEHQCVLNTTIMLVLFDMEEDGLHGSKHFVRDYLYPVEIEQRHTPVKGAIVIDMLLEYDTERDSQITNDLGPLIPSWQEAVRKNDNRADFAAVWARKNSIDTPLYKSLKRNWLNQPEYKLLLLDPPLPRLGWQLTRELSSHRLSSYKTFLRSDHSSFWYPHSLKDQSIPAILLTDLGPWRKRVAHRYHSSADNTKLLTRQNLLFLKNSVESLMKTILELGGGRCQPLDNSVEAASAA